MKFSNIRSHIYSIIHLYFKIILEAYEMLRLKPRLNTDIVVFKWTNILNYDTEMLFYFHKLRKFFDCLKSWPSFSIEVLYFCICNFISVFFHLIIISWESHFSEASSQKNRSALQYKFSFFHSTKSNVDSLTSVN